jgi:hypothetical protein
VNGRVYVRRVDDDAEFTIPSSPSVIALADIDGAPPRVASRGAAQEAFSLLFSLGFDRRVVQTYTEPRTLLEPLPESPQRPPAPASDGLVPQPALPVANGPPETRGAPSAKPLSPTMRGLAWTGVGVGAFGLATGVALSLVGLEVAHGTSASASEASAASRQSTVSAANSASAIAYPVGGVMLAAGAAALLFWPRASTHVEAAATPSGGYIGYAGSF